MIVVFNPTVFRNRHAPYFPEEKVSDEALEYWFGIACEVIPNTDDSFVPYDPDKGIFTRDRILDLLTCHYATIGKDDPSQPGPLASATEGSVSVSFATREERNSFYSQTRCGQAFLSLMRTFRVWGGVAAMPQKYHPWA